MRQKKSGQMRSKIKYVFFALFIAIEICLLYIIVFSSLNGIKYYCFVSILLCLVFTLVFSIYDIDGILTIMALLFTVISDIFLVLVEPRIQWIAMTTFSAVQILYFARLLLNVKKKYIKWHLLVRGITVFVVEIITVIVLKEKIDYVSLISMFYFANIICNLILSLLQIKVNPVFAVGLALFVCCDLLIGLNSAMGVYINVSPDSFIYKLANPSINLAWLFYIPSQVLIAISKFKFKNNVNK